MNISVSENVTLALDSVWAHRFRSMLTVLGIIIGITTVVTVASLLTGLRKGIVDFFQELGPDNIFVYRTSGDPTQDVVNLKEAKRRRLDPEYGDFILRSCYSVDGVAMTLYIPPVIGGHSLTARVPGYETDNIMVMGVTANAAVISPRDIEQGRFFSQEEQQRAAHVAVIGPNIASALFPAGNAIESTFMMDGAEYTVAGVFAKAKGGFFGENRQDSAITIPITTARLRYPQVDRLQLTVHARAGKRGDAIEEVRAAMRRIRRLAPEEPDDFALSTPDQIIQQFDSITGLIGLVAIAISGLGLLVGGIGVMNVMLISVTERTREIGVRKAVGARARDIVGQFLLEAMTLSGVGGVLGIVIAVATTGLIGLVVPALPATVPIWALTAGFSVSLAVGVFFGVWPAVKASRLDPVEALRYE